MAEIAERGTASRRGQFSSPDVGARQQAPRLSYSQVLEARRGRTYKRTSTTEQLGVIVESNGHYPKRSDGDVSVDDWTSADIIPDAYRFMQPRRLSSWVDDDTVSHCHRCFRPFGLLFRRHHCRACGRIFCDDCSSQRMCIPADYEAKPLLGETHSVARQPILQYMPGGPSMVGALTGLVSRVGQSRSITIDDRPRTVNVEEKKKNAELAAAAKRELLGESLLKLRKEYPAAFKGFKLSAESGQKDDQFCQVDEGDNLNCQRVCDDCATILVQRRRYQDTVEVFELCEFDLGHLLRLSKVCRKWRSAALICTSTFRQIQYYLPTHQLSSKEARRLWVNRRFLQGHSKWLLQLLKAVDWNIPTMRDECIRLLRGRRICDCMLTMCSRLCKVKSFALSDVSFTKSSTYILTIVKDSFEAADAFDILAPWVPDSEARSIGVEALRTASSTELACYLPLLIHHLKFEDLSSSSALQNLLWTMALKSIKLCNNLFWGLTLSAEDRECGRRYDAFRMRLFMAMAEEKLGKEVNQLIRAQDLLYLLWKTPARATVEEVKSILKIYLEQNDPFCVGPLPLPVEPSILVNNVFTDEVEVKNSAEAPVVIPFIVESPDAGSQVTQRLYRVMYKRDDLRKDAIVLNIILIMHGILKREISPDIPVLTYRVLPTSSRDGLIEIVQEAETLYRIIKNYGPHPIMSFLTKHNPDRSVSDICSCFSQTLAVYTVITFLLGVGDRHANNVMLTVRGELFHIDYGFILGRDPKPSQPPMRLDAHMIDALGGLYSAQYERFKSTCIQVFNCLRRHVGLFMNMLLLLTDASPTIHDAGGVYSVSELQSFIVQRWLPGQTDEEAALALERRMEGKLNERLGMAFSDFVHEHSREGTLSRGLSTVGDSVRVGASSVRETMSDVAFKISIGASSIYEYVWRNAS